MQRHEADDGLVAVRDPEGRAVDPDPKGDTCDQYRREQDEPAESHRTLALDQAAGAALRTAISTPGTVTPGPYVRLEARR